MLQNFEAWLSSWLPGFGATISGAVHGALIILTVLCGVIFYAWLLRMIWRDAWFNRRERKR